MATHQVRRVGAICAIAGYRRHLRLLFGDHTPRALHIANRSPSTLDRHYGLDRRSGHHVECGLA